MKTLKLFGPPGTGKTYTLLKYFEEELKTTSPNRIGFVTFTRAARHEALNRSKLTEQELPWVKTLHAMCYKLLDIHQDQLATTANIRAFGSSIGVQLSGYMPDLFGLEAVTESFQQPTKADRLLQLNHLGRHRGLKLKESLKDAPLELDFHYAKWFTEAYRNWKTATAKLDYTDLLSDYLKYGSDLDLDVLFVDESQDLSWLQWAVVRKLSKNVKTLYLAGDDDQTIFRWAGASASLFNLEPANEVRVLPQSYRLPRQVHAVSQKIIKRVKVRQEKEFRPREAEGEHRPIGRLDGTHLDGDSTLVLFRNHHRGVSLGLQLEELGVPFLGPHSALSSPDVMNSLRGWSRVQANQPIPTPEVRSMLGFSLPIYLHEGAKERAEGEGEFSATSIFNEPALTMPFWKVMPKMPRLGYLQRVVGKGTIARVLTPAIQLLSIHQSKGREAHTVVLDLELARRTYESYMHEPDDEHRVFYVGVTRAKQRLLTLLPTESMSYVI